LGLFLSWIYHFANHIVKPLLFAITITLAFSFLNGFQTTLGIFLVLFLALLVAMLFFDNAKLLLGIFALFFLASIVFLPMQKPLDDIEQWQITSNADKSLPDIIYLILDEHAGVDALPVTEQSERVFKTHLENFYLQNGFRLYASAYSHYPMTYNSIPNLLNFTAHNKDDYYAIEPQQHELKQNEFFTILAKKGYQFRVYQSDFISYCHPNQISVNGCYIYPSLSLKNLEKVSLPISQRSLFVFKGFLLQSFCYQTAMHFYQYNVRPMALSFGWNFPEWRWTQARTSTLVMLDSFAHLRADVLAHPNGTVFFAHLLAPHNPFVYDANCHLIPKIADWQIGHGPAPLENSPATREQRYVQYEGQIGCVETQLQQLFSVLQQAGIYDKTIIIVHGDHGSRIGLHDPNPKNINILTAQDFKDYYITLFATKIPQQTAGIDHHLFDLQYLLAHSLQQITGQTVTYQANAPFVFLYPTKLNAILQQKLIKNFI
jgi:hypothetical protein